VFRTQPIRGLGAGSACRRGRRCAVPRGGRRGASLSPAADRGKGASLFSAEGGFNLVSRGRKWGFVRNRYVIWVQAQPARKTSHREVFLGCANRKLAWGLFSYKSPLFCNPNFGLQNSPAKAPDDKELRPLRRATSRRCPLDTRHLLKKVDENFYFANSVPRGKNSGYLLNRYAIWARHHAA